MEMEVIGYRKVSFKGEDGVQISGVSLYVTWIDEHVEGVACEKIFVSEAKLEGHKVFVGESVRIHYNRYGKIGSLEWM